MGAQKGTPPAPPRGSIPTWTGPVCPLLSPHTPVVSDLPGAASREPAQAPPLPAEPTPRHNKRFLGGNAPARPARPEVGASGAGAPDPAFLVLRPGSLEGGRVLQGDTSAESRVRLGARTARRGCRETCCRLLGPRHCFVLRDAGECLLVTRALGRGPVALRHRGALRGGGPAPHKGHHRRMPGARFHGVQVLSSSGDTLRGDPTRGRLAPAPPRPQIRRSLL